MARLVFRDFDEFADSIEGVAGRFIPTARSASEWWIEAVRPGSVHLQQLQIGSATTFAGDGEPDSYTFGLPMTDPRQIRIDGHFLEPDAFIMLHEDQPFTFTGQDVVRWAGVSIPKDTALIAPELLLTARSGNGPRTRTAQPYLDRLRWMTSRAVSGAESIDFSEAAAVQSIEQEITLCLTHVLALVESAAAAGDSRRVAACRSATRHGDAHCRSLRRLGFQSVRTQLQGAVR
jgi:AraC family transcriptional regulator, ethanolamine operon transcriptional activator